MQIERLAIAVGILLLFGAPFVGMAAAAVLAAVVRWRMARSAAIAFEDDQRRLMSSWAQAADLLGFKLVGPDEMEGTFQGRPARVKWRDGSFFLEVVVPEPVLVALPRTPTDIVGTLTGDADFDVKWDYTFPEKTPSLLRREVREAMQTLSGLGPVRVWEGHLRLQVEDGDDPAAVISDALSALSTFGDVVLDASASNATVVADPQEPMRMRMAALLALVDPSTADVGVLEPLLDDLDDELRWAVTFAVKDESRLFDVLRDGRAPVDVRKRAANQLVLPQHMAAVVAALVASEERELWWMAAEFAARHPASALSQKMFQAFDLGNLDLGRWNLGDEEGHNALVHLCQAFLKAPVEGVESFLAAALRYGLPVHQQQLILQRLVVHGSVEQVPTLRATQEHVATDLSQRIEAAIIEIQTSSGGLAGAVSIVEASSRGAVSIVEPEDRPHLAASRPRRTEGS